MKFIKNKIIIFDLLGVITVEGMWATNIIYPLIRNNISYDLFKKKYLLYSLGLISGSDFWEYICKEYICNKKDIKIIEKKIIKKTKITPGIQRIIASCKKSGFRVYLVSEIPERWGQMIIRKAKLSNYFNKKYFSSTLGSTKPFKIFYKSVLKDLPINNIIYYVDDSFVNVIAAKKMMGAIGILYSKKITKHSDIAVINKIDDLHKKLYD